MRTEACWAGRHRTSLEVVEVCCDCGDRRRRGRTTRLALALVPLGLWTNALLLLALVAR